MKYSALVGILLSASAFVAIGSVAEAAEPVAQRDYVWFTAGEPSGIQTVKLYSGGRLSIHFKYNDRGRGPDTTTAMELDTRGLIRSFAATGVNYSKGAIDERFEVNRNIAIWRSSLEQGKAPMRADQLYFPVNQPPEYRAVLARALLAQPDRQLHLLPAGSARIEEVETMTFAIGSELRVATLYGISGLGLTPDYVWLDEDKTLIGYGAGWFAVLRKGWSEYLPKIKAAQEAAQARYIKAQAERFAHRIAQPIAIVNARVLDSETGRLGMPATVLVRDGLIAEISPAGATVPRNVYTIDARGKTLMAALWDMHSHISPADYLHYIASGVLNVRDMGNDPEYLANLRADIATGVVAAPDIYPMGFLDKRSPYSAPTGRLAKTLDEARGFVRAYADDGYVGIKLYSSIEPAWVPVLSRDARALGLGTAGHIPSFMSPRQAIYDGYSEVTHINMVLLQLIGDWTIDTRTPQRFIVTGERGGLIDVEAAEAKAFLDLMVERHIAHDPTLATFMDEYYSRPGEILPSAVAYADRLPPSLRREQIAEVSYNQGKEDAFRRTGEVALMLIKRLHDRGVQILPGTDMPLPGFALISELQYYVKAGIANADVLRLATLEAARHMNRDKELGSVAVGKKAYLMLIDGDPTQDLSVLRKVDHVIKGNAVLRSREILQMQGIKPF